MQSKISFLYLVSIKSYKYRNLSCRKSRRNGINRNRRNRNQLILAIVQRMRFNGSRQTLENNETNQKGNNSCGEMFTIMFFFLCEYVTVRHRACCISRCIIYWSQFDFVLVSRRATTKARKPGYQESTKWCLVLGFVESNWKHSSHIRPHGKLVIRFDSNKSSQTTCHF
jgi:hypothetical protein